MQGGREERGGLTKATGAQLRLDLDLEFSVSPTQVIAPLAHVTAGERVCKGALLPLLSPFSLLFPTSPLLLLSALPPSSPSPGSSSWSW